MKAYFLRSIYLYLRFAGMYLTLEETLGLFANGNVILFLLGIDCLFSSFVRWKWGRIFWYGWNGLVFITGAFLWKKVLRDYVCGKLREKTVRLLLPYDFGAKEGTDRGRAGGVVSCSCADFAGVCSGNACSEKRTGCDAGSDSDAGVYTGIGMWKQFPGVGDLSGSIVSFCSLGYGKQKRKKKFGISFGGCRAGSILLLLAFVCGTLLQQALYKRADKLNRELYGKVQEVTAKMSSAVRSQNGFSGDHTPTADGSLNVLR